MGKSYRLRAEPVGPLPAAGDRPLDPRAHLVHVRLPHRPDSRPPVTAGTVGTLTHGLYRDRLIHPSRRWVTRSMKIQSRRFDAPHSVVDQGMGPCSRVTREGSSHSRSFRGLGSSHSRLARVNCRLPPTAPVCPDDPRPRSTIRPPDPLPESDPAFRRRRPSIREEGQELRSAGGETGPELSLGECIAIAVERQPEPQGGAGQHRRDRGRYRALMNFGTVGTIISPDLDIRKQQAQRGLAGSGRRIPEGPQRNRPGRHADVLHRGLRQAATGDRRQRHRAARQTS